MSGEEKGLLFEEEQRFRQWWIWVLLVVPELVVMGVFGYALYAQLVLGRPWASEGNTPLSGVGLVGLTLFVVAMALIGPVLFLFMKLIVRVDGQGLHVRFVPFVRRTISLNEIQQWDVRTYSPIREYGGWGIRWAWKRGVGRAYNVSGNRGVQLELSDGKRLLIGSQCPEELADAIRRAKWAQGQGT